MARTTSEYRKEVTERLIGMLESGTAPWQKPWDAGIAAMNRPHNFNGRPYHGVNALMLWCTAIDKGYEDPRWLTFNQVKKLGGHVNRGEKAQLVEYWQWEKEVENPETGEKEKVQLDHPRVFRASVFNADQCSGLPTLERPVQQWTPHERAERIVAANGVPVMHTSGEGAYYSPGRDYICLPPKESFATEDAYYSTLLHEVGHSTGHRERLNREFGGPFGSESYAKEELRAELASTFLCGELGIATSGSDEQHAAYVKSWVRALKDDYNEIFRAAADAEKICNYLYDKEQEYLKMQEAGLTPVTKAQPEPAVNAADENVMRRMTPEEYAQAKGGDNVPNTGAVDANYDYYYTELGRQKNILVDLRDYILSNDLDKFADRADRAELDERASELGFFWDRGNVQELLDDVESKIDEINKELNAPATKEQLDLLKQMKVYYPKNITAEDAETKIFVASAMLNEEGKKMAKDEKAAEIPATNAQKGFLEILGCKFEDNITKGEADRMIKERVAKRNEYMEKMNAPATQEQKDMLTANGRKFEENITVGEASKIIGKLPCTVEQMDYLDKLKIEYNPGITRGEASKLIEQKMKQIEARDNMPATEKQLATLKAHGVEHAADITRGEARAQIYLSPATDRQINFLNVNKIEYDKSKICFGKAGYLIEKFQAAKDISRKEPATRAQLGLLDDMKIKYDKGITKGEAYDLIQEQKKAEKAVTEKQVNKAKELGLELPKNATRQEAAQLIEIKGREDKIAGFTAKSETPDAYDKYLELANKQYAKTGDFSKIDDKKIAAEMLKQGYEKEAVTSAITEHSPVGRNYNRADATVEAASKLRSVAKAMENSKGADKGR